MSRKLNNTDRRTIISKALSKAFDERLKTNKKEYNDLLIKAYNEIVPPSVLEKLKGVPKQFIHQGYAFNCQLSNGHSLYLSSNKPRVVPSERQVLSKKLSDEFEDHYRAKEDLQKEHRALELKIDSLLNSVTTVGRLEEIWPEGRQFYEDLTGPVYKPGLPAVTIDQINTALGLPKKKQGSLS